MSIGPKYEDRITWQPVPGLKQGRPSSQALAVSCQCNVVLYDGSRGPGKTDAQLMRFRSMVGLGYGKFLRGVIFDRQYNNLDDLIAKSEKHFKAFGDGARLIKSAKDLKWVWPTGEELLFRAIKKESDYLNFHGQEFPWIGWNELTKYPNRKLFDMMFSCNRSGFIPEVHTPRLSAEDVASWNEIYPGKQHERGLFVTGDFATRDGRILPNIPLQVFATTNPWGPGHAWVKKQFIDGIDAGEIVYETTNVFNPRTKQREDVVRTQVRLFGTYKENIYLDPLYVAGLERETDPNRRKAWLLGDWNIKAGGMFDDLWNPSVHVVPNFKVPLGWYIDRAFDWGSSHPFSVGWYCIANGETITLEDGRRWTPKRGSVIRFAEWYGTAGGINEGLRMSGPDIAAGIMEREMKMLQAGTISKIPSAGPADGQIYQTRESDVATIGSKMAEEGIEWEEADKSKDSRKNGWQLMRDALTNSIKGEGSGLFFTKSCKYAIGFMADTPRDEDDPDDVDTDTEDHCQDEIRYRVRKMISKFGSGLHLTFAT